MLVNIVYLQASLSSTSVLVEALYKNVVQEQSTVTKEEIIFIRRFLKLQFSTSHPGNRWWHASWCRSYCHLLQALLEQVQGTSPSN